MRLPWQKGDPNSPQKQPSEEKEAPSGPQPADGRAGGGGLPEAGERVLRIDVRVSPAEKSLIEERAREAGLPLSGYLRTRGLRGRPGHRPARLVRASLRAIALELRALRGTALWETAGPAGEEELEALIARLGRALDRLS
jgi:hypothetical protein